MTTVKADASQRTRRQQEAFTQSFRWPPRAATTRRRNVPKRAISASMWGPLDQHGLTRQCT